MKHVSGAALNPLRDLLEKIRRYSNLDERAAGVFYRKRSAFLHFHEDSGQFFADLKVGAEWIRLPVRTPAEEAKLLQAVDRELKDSALGKVARSKKTTRKASP